MPNWKKVIVSGSDAVLNSVTTPAGTINTFTASFAVSTSLADRSTRLDLVALNQTGGSLAKGTVVRIQPVSNASDIPRIVTASYESDTTSAATLGITAETIANGNTGYVITAGILTGVSTTGWNTGTLLFLGSGGAITATAPTAPNHSVRLGQVVREQSVNGSIYVRVDNGTELGELHDVLDSTTTTSYGDLLVKSGSAWINSKQMTGSYGLTGSLAVNGPIYFASDAAGSNGLSFVRNGSNNWTWGTSGIGNVMVIAGNSITLPQVVYTTNGLNVTPGGNSTSYGLIVTSGSYPAATIFRAGVNDIAVTGSKVGLGTLTPAAKVHISGASGASLQIDKAGGAASIYGTNSLIFETDTSFRFGQYVARDFYINNTNGTSGTVFVSAAGSLGIGTVTPGQKIDVVGSGQFSSQVIVGANTVATTEATLVLGTPPAGGSGEGGQLALQPASGFTSGAFVDNYQNKLRFLRGTATTSDAFKMQIDLQTGQVQIPNYTGTSAFPGTAAATLAVDSSGNVITISGAGSGTVTSVSGTGTVSGITLSGTVTTSGNLTLGGSISGLTNANLSGTAGITNANLANSAITIAGTSTSLGGSISQATILAGSGVWSGSAQLPSGVVSGSSQINGASITNNGIIIGTTSITLGSSATTITGLSSVTSTTFVGSLTGTASGNLTSASTLTAGNLSGTIPSGVLGNSTLYVGTTAVALNRGSANQHLTGISSIQFPGSISGTATLRAPSAAGTPTINLPITTGDLICTGDTGTVTNTMLANSTISGVALGSSLAALTAGSYLTSAGTYNGSTARTFAVDATSANTVSKVVARDGSGNFSAGRITTTGLFGPSGTGNLPIWQYDSSNTGYGIVYNEGTPDTLRIDVSGQALVGTPDFLVGDNYAQINGNTVWHAGNDGATSGLDADLLDGQHGSYYYPASNPNGYTTNTGTVTSVATSGTVSGITLTGGTITTSGTITLGGSISGLTTSNLSSTANIANSQLANSSVTIGSTAVSLGSSATTITGLTSVTSTWFTGSLFGTASVATAVVVANPPSPTTYLPLLNSPGSGNAKFFSKNTLTFDNTTDTLAVNISGNAVTANYAASVNIQPTATAFNILGDAGNGYPEYDQTGGLKWSPGNQQMVMRDPATGNSLLIGTVVAGNGEGYLEALATRMFYYSDRHIFGNNAYGYSGQFDGGGNFDAANDITCGGTKFFDIPHQGKEGWGLKHAAIEGPESAVYYRGKLSGADTIELPDYWKWLVHEDTITVTLTPVGQYQALYVKSIQGNVITIGSDGDHVNCHYHVYGERKDVDRWQVEYENYSRLDR